MEGTGKPEYGKCVEISTKAALREMMLPGVLTIGFPIAIVLLGKLVYADNNQLIAEMLGGYMAGVTVSGVLWAVFQNNAGGAWDNAKKSFEAGVEINGEMTYKGSDAHKAAVTGDTVGDPFKDTSGPSMNILIKLTCLIGLVIAPILGNSVTQKKEMKCTMDVKMECKGDMMGKCDMSKCATMTKEQCAAMCDSLKCTPEQKEACLSHYDADGKFVAPKACKEEAGKSCCAKESSMEELEKGTNHVSATITKTVDGKKVTETIEGTYNEVKAKMDAMK
jgi:K(+)-stimulated pyrophosphate-energized sodium pump